MNFYYVADFNLPSFRAYVIHVIKMVDKFNLISTKTELIIPYSKKNYNFQKIKKDFLLSSRKRFKIINIFKKLKNISFLSRLFFGLSSAIYLKNKSGIILTRNFYCSFFLIFFKKKHFLETHSELSGFTKFLFLNLNFMKSKFIINNIFITKSLKNFYKNKANNHFIIPDGVDVNNFKNKKKIKKNIKKIYYIGSFYKGRGIELIYNIAKRLTKFKFILIGKRNENYFFEKLQNIKIKNYIKYKNVPKELMKADILLMPYSLNKVLTNSSGSSSNTAKYASPIKMFEYLASGRPILSSNLRVLKEILVDKENCVIVKNNSLNKWVNAITMINNNFNLRKKISKNALKTANKFTWFNRAKLIKKLYLKNIKN